MVPSTRSLVAAVAALSAPFLVNAYPTPEAKILERAAQVQSEYDYVVVGGGTAGLTVADRLTEDGRFTVLVVEIGDFDDSTSVLLVKGGSAGMDDSRMFNFQSVPQPNVNNQPAGVQLGRCVGGSSAVNGMVFLRGTDEDYDRWAELGSEGSTWGWDGILPYFKRAFKFTPPVPELQQEFGITYDIIAAWGGFTKIFASFPTFLWPGVKNMWNAFKEIPGVEFPVEHGTGKNGVFWFPTSMHPTEVTRSYSRIGHYDEVLPRNNYEIVVNSKVTKVTFNGDIADGVQFTQSGTTTSIKARKEVIMAAGTLHTPQILQRSGIGDSSLLQRAGISVKSDLPGVGANFQDHNMVTFFYFFQNDVSPSPNNQDSEFNAWAEELWAANRTGPNSLAAGNAGAWLGLPVVAPDRYEAIASAYESQDPAAYLPADTHEDVIRGYAAQKASYANAMRSKYTSFYEMMITGMPGGGLINLHPVSRGTVKLDPSDQDGNPLVDYCALCNPIDLEVMVEMVKFTRRYFQTSEMQKLQPMEYSPGSSIQTDDEIKDFIRQSFTASTFHPIGTCAKMPREMGGVVDEDLLVYGVKQLSVVDASIMPTLIGATTSQTVYAIAEKAADLIKARS